MIPVKSVKLILVSVTRIKLTITFGSWDSCSGNRKRLHSRMLFLLLNERKLRSFQICFIQLESPQQRFSIFLGQIQTQILNWPKPSIYIFPFRSSTICCWIRNDSVILCFLLQRKQAACVPLGGQTNRDTECWREDSSLIPNGRLGWKSMQELLHVIFVYYVFMYSQWTARCHASVLGFH